MVKEVGILSTSAILSIVAPIKMLIFITLSFIAVNFVCNALLTVDRSVKKRSIPKLSSFHLKVNMYNAFFACIIITFSHLLTYYVIPVNGIPFDRMATGIICTLEFISIAKKATYLTHKKAYKYISMYLKSRTLETKKGA